MSKNAVVTGASSGIGRETVRALARADWKILAVARRADRLEELHGEFHDHVVPFALGGSNDSENVVVVRK